MTKLIDMTKKQLLVLAKEHDVTGRHDMTKEQLIAELEDLVGEEDEGENDEDLNGDDDAEELEPAEETASKEVLIEMKRRNPSRRPRGDNGQIIRVGANLSGNVPFRRKYYYLQAALANEKLWTAEYKEALMAAPNQVKLILRWMRQAEITDPTCAEQGRDIVEGAKKAKLLVSKISSDALAAYYRRLLEALGVRESDEMED